MELEKQKVDIQRDLFLRRVNLELSRQNSEEEKIKKLIQVDDRIVRLKRQVMEAKQAQWQEGTVTTADLIQCAPMRSWMRGYGRRFTNCKTLKTAISIKTYWAGMMNDNIFMKRALVLISAMTFFFSCKKDDENFDARGYFETDETDVVSQVAGIVSKIFKEEGDDVKAGEILTILDDTDLKLQKDRIQARINALREKSIDLQPQLAVLEQQRSVQNTQLKNLQKEAVRYRRLVDKDAAPKKQLDDIHQQIRILENQIALTRKQMALQKSDTETRNRSIQSERMALDQSLKLAENQVKKAAVAGPISGTILVKSVNQGEYVTPGKLLYTVGDLTLMTLKVYVTGSQLPRLKPSQAVSVFTDDGQRGYKTYAGRISWISAQAEFTPKTIQTKDERENLVYAVKIRVKNDGALKSGMFGQVKFDRAMSSSSRKQ